MIDFIDLLNSIKEGALESSLLDALSHWRNRPTAELANTIDCLGHALTQDRIDISGNDSTAITNWIQEVSLDPVKLTWLLKPITNVGALHAANRLKLLREYPDSDPRFDMALVQWLEAIPYRSSVGKSFYEMVLERAKKIRDVRTIPILENLDSHFQQYFNTVNGRWLAGQTRKVLGPLLKTLKKEASLVESAANVSILLECEAILKTTKPANSIVGREAQLARVLADPTNDDERMVYADLLSEEGMVQGELIVLQMQAKRTKAQNKRVKEILKKHATDFLGPLAAVVLKRDFFFEKGL